MNKQFIIPTVGLFGLLGAVAFTFSYGSEKASAPNYLALPPSSPYSDAVWGTGIIEASSKNIGVGSHLSGIIAKLFVTEGDEVKEGAPLFQLDDREAQSEYKTRASAVDAAEANLQGAGVTLRDREDQLHRLQGLKEGIEISKEKLQQAIFAVDKAKTDQAQAKAQLEMARAEKETAGVTLDQMTVYAPSTGRIMKINIQPGEFVTAGSTPEPPVLMGNDRPLYLRVSIDENDLWRFDPKSPAKASLRSHKDIEVPLVFVRVEPYVMPKEQLNNSPSERVDTRVLQVIYRIDADNPALYIGQQMDVFIEAQGNIKK
jgi:RND family efflux transporter MFP subunit